ncbi:unnamed protein product, partial [Choristocarpus tenellus]
QVSPAASNSIPTWFSLEGYLSLKVHFEEWTQIMISVRGGRSCNGQQNGKRLQES